MLRNAVFPGLEMKVWRSCAAGASRCADQRTPTHHIARLGTELERMRIARDEATAMISLVSILPY